MCRHIQGMAHERKVWHYLTCIYVVFTAQKAFSHIVMILFDLHSLDIIVGAPPPCWALGWAPACSSEQDQPGAGTAMDFTCQAPGLV